MPETAIVRDPIDVEDVLRRVGGPADGAVVLFVGVVRDHADGRAVSGVCYEAYEGMAADVLAAIAAEASSRFPVARVAAAHRVGELRVGDVSVAIAVSGAHRAAAYDASRYMIEEIKRRLPVWKKERYVEGDAVWVGGAVPTVGDAAPGGPQ